MSLCLSLSMYYELKVELCKSVLTLSRPIITIWWDTEICWVFYSLLCQNMYLGFKSCHALAVQRCNQYVVLLILILAENETFWQSFDSCIKKRYCCEKGRCELGVIWFSPHFWEQVPLEEGLNKAIHYFRKELEYQANNQYIPKPKPARMKKGRTRHNWRLLVGQEIPCLTFDGCNFSFFLVFFFFFERLWNRCHEEQTGISFWSLL